MLKETDTIEHTLTSWTAYSAHLQGSLPSAPVIRGIAELEEAVELLTAFVKEAIEATSRKRFKICRHDQLQAEIVDLIPESQAWRFSLDV